MTTVDHYDMLEWAKPWPIGFRGRRKWKLMFLSLAQAKKLKSCNRINGRRLSIATTYRHVMEKNWGGWHHVILGLARSRAAEKRPFIIVAGGIVWDGNHTLLALIHSKYQGKVLAAVAASKARGKHVWFADKKER